MEDTIIDYNVVIKYTDQNEYRKIICKILKIKQEYVINNNNIIFNDGIIINCDDINDETLNEIQMNLEKCCYDKCINYILHITKNIDKIVELYEWSSINILSINNRCGISNLLTYYYLPHFYKILCKLHNSGIDVNKIEYNNLITTDMIDSVKHAMEYAEYEPFFD